MTFASQTTERSADVPRDSLWFNQTWMGNDDQLTCVSLFRILSSECLLNNEQTSSDSAASTSTLVDETVRYSLNGLGRVMLTFLRSPRCARANLMITTM